MRLVLFGLLFVSTLSAVTYRVTANVTGFKVTKGRVGADRTIIPGSIELTLADEPQLPKARPSAGHSQPLPLPSPGYRVAGRISRIDPVTQIAEIDLQEPLSTKNSYRILNESGETIGTAKNVTQGADGHYAFSFDSRRRNLSAGRRVVFTVATENFSALADRPRQQKEPALRMTLRDDAAMQFIPEGLFILGGSDTHALHFIPAERDGRAGNRIDVAGFFIDQHEVTVGQYIRYLEETRQKIPEEMLAQARNLPLTHMTYREAETYCAWTGKRLPTELEWEKAARGTQIMTTSDETYTTSQSFPISEIKASELCVTSDTGGMPIEINKLKDRNEFGLIGMCGNAAEWTSSWLLPYRGNTRQDERFGKRYKVIRGGSFELPLELAKSYARLAGGIPTLSRDRRAGFRCARSE